MTRRRPVFDRFWPKVDSSGGDDACWPWLGSTGHGFGYGCFRDRGRTYMAHRFALHLVTGEPLDTPLQALHSCDNPPCVNPAHLRWGTQKENIADARDRGRWSPPPANPGRTTNHKLTPAQVAEIRRRVSQGETQAAMCREFGMTSGAISLIVNRKLWKRVA